MNATGAGAIFNFVRITDHVATGGQTPFDKYFFMSPRYLGGKM